MLIDICLPVHNEEIVLEKNTLRLFEFCKKQFFPFEWRIVIIINGSNDRSLEIARTLASHNEKIIVKNIITPGRGKALATYWLESSADIVAYMDCDLAVELNSLPPLLFKIIDKEADLVIGRRLGPGVKIKRSINREIISRCFNFLAKKFLGHSHRDLQCGFKSINRLVYLKLSPFINNDGWFFDTEIITWADQLSYKVLELPVNWQETRFDIRKSKVKLVKDSLYFIENLYKLRKKIKFFKKTSQL